MSSEKSELSFDKNSSQNSLIFNDSCFSSFVKDMYAYAYKLVHKNNIIQQLEC